MNTAHIIPCLLENCSRQHRNKQLMLRTVEGRNKPVYGRFRHERPFKSADGFAGNARWGGLIPAFYEQELVKPTGPLFSIFFIPCPIGDNNCNSSCAAIPPGRICPLAVNS